MLRIPDDIRAGLIAHARSCAPLEGCGYLGGEGEEVTAFMPMHNVDQSAQHFSFEPAEQFAVVRELRTRGLKAVGIYHSHPETPARPSEEDIRLAFDSSMAYVIVSLAANEPDIKAFRIARGEVCAVPIAP